MRVLHSEPYPAGATIAARSLLRFMLFGVIMPGFMAPAADAAATPACIEQVDGLFAPWNSKDSPGAVVGIFDDGRILHARGYGIADLDHGIALSSRTVLRVGSVSKQFIGMAIALLAEQGKLSVSDDIRKYLPEMPDYGKPITLSHLLHHTSGIREYLTLVSLIGKPEGSGYIYTPQDLLFLLARQKALEFAPGEVFSYSNSGYFLLAEIISRVSGTRTSGFLEEHIFRPLGMNATRLHDDPNSIVRNRGAGYSSAKEGGFRIDMVRLEVVGDLGILTSVEDLFKWDRNFDDNRLGNASPQLIKTALTPGSLNSGKSLDYAYGLIVGDYRGLKAISHSGSEPGYVAYYLRFPEQRFSVVILSNLSSLSPARLAGAIADRCLTDQFAGPAPPMSDEEPLDDTTPTRALGAAEAAAYAGDYYSEELDVVYRFRLRDGELHLAINALSGSLRARAADHLWWEAGTADLAFTRDSHGQIDGFLLRSESVRDLGFVRLGGG